MGFALRRAIHRDLEACVQVRSRSSEEYLRRLNQPWFAGDKPSLIRLCTHLMRTDPNRFWLAQSDADERSPGEVVGFGAASSRGPVTFLGMLFVAPEFQGRGIGSGLLERVLAVYGTDPSATARDLSRRAFALATDSAQPIANAMYAACGIMPREPVFDLVAPTSAAPAITRLPAGFKVEWFPEALNSTPGVLDQLLLDFNALDQATVGFEHPQDHRYLWHEHRQGLLVRDGGAAVAGYGYASRLGRVGPIAAVDPALLLPMIGELGQARMQAGARRRLWVPTGANEVFRGLLNSGWRIDGFPKLLCWSRPFGRFDRYLPGSLTLL